MVNVLHVHGFNSSPKSMKAQLSRAFFTNMVGVNFHCPQLKNSANEAITQLEQIIESKPQQTWLLIGSSLGGYFSTYLAEKYNTLAALINPAVKPFDLLNEHLGTHVNPYTKDEYQVMPEHISDLKVLEKNKITKKNYLVMVQTGDEVLDYQQAVEKYQCCQLIVQQGGDHSFVDFEKMLPQIALFFNL